MKKLYPVKKYKKQLMNVGGELWRICMNVSTKIPPVKNTHNILMHSMRNSERL